MKIEHHTFDFHCLHLALAITTTIKVLLAALAFLGYLGEL